MFTGGNDDIPYPPLINSIIIHAHIYKPFHNFHFTQWGCVPLFILSSLVRFQKYLVLLFWISLKSMMCCMNFPCIVSNFSCISPLRADWKFSEQYNVKLKLSWFFHSCFSFRIRFLFCHLSFLCTVFIINNAVGYQHTQRITFVIT